MARKNIKTWVVIDTNVLLVANGRHEGVSPECVLECIKRLKVCEKSGGLVIDNQRRILDEYLKKTYPNQPKGPGDVFLKWLLRNLTSSMRVEQVVLTEPEKDYFLEFPDQTLQPQVDPADRKFMAVANAHPNKPPIWQATDGKWMGWEYELKAKGLEVDFLCPKEAQQFYQSSFPHKTLP